MRGLPDALEFEGFEWSRRARQATACELMRERGADCVLLDLMLPDDNGYACARRSAPSTRRCRSSSSRREAQESDKIRGLDAGADDYVTKPFSVAELIARINAIFRRQAHARRVDDETFAIGDADQRRQEAHDDARAQEHAADVLRARGAEAAARAARGDGVARRAAREGLGHRGAPTSAPSTTSSSSCAKLEEDSKEPRHILTVYGLGYKLVP